MLGKTVQKIKTFISRAARDENFACGHRSLRPPADRHLIQLMVDQRLTVTATDREGEGRTGEEGRGKMCSPANLKGEMCLCYSAANRKECLK